MVINPGTINSWEKNIEQHVLLSVRRNIDMPELVSKSFAVTEADRFTKLAIIRLWPVKLVYWNIDSLHSIVSILFTCSMCKALRKKILPKVCLIEMLLNAFVC